jgi:vacuolar-type H+-ATPase subunit F/Vma7
VVSEQEETIFDMAKEAIEPLQKQPNDVFATLLATAETIETTPKPIIDESGIPPMLPIPSQG